MTTVVDAYAHARDGEPVVICDFSPPRSGDPAFVERIAELPADFIVVAYNPGRIPRADSIAVAHVIQQRLGKRAVFSIAPRDMNTIALQSQLLGAAMLGLENAVILAGDDLSEREQALGVQQVRDIAPTMLIAATAAMNEGKDYRGSNLQSPTSFCIGGTIDLGRGLEREAKLAAAKVESGAQFLLSQPGFSLEERGRFLAAYEAISDAPLAVPVFWGLQILAKDGLVFGKVPASIREDLEKGRDGADIAAEMLASYVSAGIRGVYLVPPIRKGGVRDYAAAQSVLRAAGR